MDFTSLTGPEFDALVHDTLETAAPLTERKDDLKASLSLIYGSEVVERYITNVIQLLQPTLVQMFASIFVHGVRHGWKAREVCMAHTDAVQDFMSGIQLNETDILNSIKPTGEQQ